MKNIIDLLSRLWFVIFVIACLLLLAVGVAFSQTTEINEARYFTETDQNQKAIAHLEKAIAKYPSMASILYYYGIAQLREGQLDPASNTFNKGIGMDEKEPLNYVGRGHVSVLNDNLEKAKLDFDKALSLSKAKNVAVLQSIGEAYLEGKHTSEALKVLSKASALASQDATTLVLLGDAYLQQNNGGLAVTSYERAAELNPKSARPHYKIGLVYLRSKNFTAAQAALTKAVELDPWYTLAYKELGELFYQLKQGEKAVSYYEKYLALTSKPAIGKLRYAFFLFMAKDFSKANEIFKELAEKADVTPITLRFYAVSLFEAGDYQQSRNVFERYFAKAETEGVEASDYGYFGKLLLKQNDDSLAIENLRRSISMENRQPDVLQLLAETYFKTRKYPEAISSYEQLIELRGKASSHDYYSLGRAYYFNKQYELADTIFQKLIELQPNMTVGYLWEARAKSNLDPESENGLARPYYEKLIEKASANPEKNKNDLAEAYSYLGYYHFLKQETQLSKSYWQKVVAINPEDAKAKEALKALN
jgi:tetratricopeptide (TPR) repeat protein